MGVQGAVLEIPSTFPSAWWEAIEIPGAAVDILQGNVTVRRGDAVVTVYAGTFPASGGVPVLAVQYKEFWLNRTENKRLTEAIIDKLIGLGAKRLER